MVVLFGDAAICLVVILGVSVTNLSGETNVAILTSAFTAVATMTTAYFGIRSIANTAQSSVVAASSGQSPAAVQQATVQAVAAQAAAAEHVTAAQTAAEQATAAQHAAAAHATVAQEAAKLTIATQSEQVDDQLEDGVATDDDVTHQDEDPEAEQLAGPEVAYDLGDDNKGGA